MTVSPPRLPSIRMEYPDYLKVKNTFSFRRNRSQLQTNEQPSWLDPFLPSSSWMGNLLSIPGPTIPNSLDQNPSRRAIL